MNLIIDIGNTQFKVCVFHNSDIVYHAYINNIKKSFISRLVAEYQIKKAIYSDTRGINKTEFLSKIPEGLPIVELTHTTPLPIKIEYKTPETLGKDRIAGAVASSGLFNGYPCLIIDIGTAITIDFISEGGAFQGGNISPGPEIRYRALHEFTGKLPMVEPVENTELMGSSTQTAIQGGVQNGILFEINGYISRFKEQYPNLKIIITGGFAFLFDKKINYPIFADSFLIPKGLNRILIYNDKQT